MRICPVTADTNRYLARLDKRAEQVESRRAELLSDSVEDLAADVVARYSDDFAEIAALLYAGKYTAREAAARIEALIEAEADSRAEDDQAGWDDDLECDRIFEAEREAATA